MVAQMYYVLIILALLKNGLSLPAVPHKKGLDSDYGVDDGLYSHGRGENYRRGGNDDCNDSHGDSSEEIIYNHGHPHAHELNDYQNGGRSYVKSSAAASASSYSESSSV